jgi:hypothetical protein
MDVFHKVLTKIYEISGGRETHDVDFIELLKQEGFYPSRDSIKEHLSTEGWIIDSGRPSFVRITHWGMAEAKKAIAGPGTSDNGAEQFTGRLQKAAKDLSAAVNEVVNGPSGKTVKQAEDRLGEISDLLGKIKKSLG